MGSNEEYLDNLLKSMNDSGEKSENAIMSAEEIEAMFAAAEKVAAGESEEAGEGEAQTPMTGEQESNGDGEPEIPLAQDGMEEQSQEELTAEEQDLAPILDGHTVESTKNLSQEEIEQLLAMSEQADTEVTGEAKDADPVEAETSESEDLLSLLDSLKDDAELGEIGELLNKSDHNVAVEEDIFAMPEEDGEPDAGYEEESADAEGPDAVLAGERTTAVSKKEERKRKKEQKKKEKKAKKEKRAIEEANGQDAAEELQSDTSSGGEEAAEETGGEENTGEEAAKATQPAKKAGRKAEKKQGLLAKLFSNLLEEEPEKAETDENQAIMKELEEEDKKAAGKKKKPKKGKLPADGKKGKGEEPEEEEEEDKGKGKGKKKEKPKKAAKPKKVKEPKTKVTAVDERPPRKISKKSILVVLLFAATVFVAIWFSVSFLSNVLLLKEARAAFERQDYVTCYETLYGVERSEEEQTLFKHAEIVLKMQRRIAVYEKYMADNQELEALDSLMRAVAGYDELYGLAQTYGAASETAALYSRILQILESNYGLTEAEARTIAFCDSNVEYTRYLTALVDGQEVSMEGGEGSIALPEEGMEDVLPAEEELTAPEFAD